MKTRHVYWVTGATALAVAALVAACASSGEVGSNAGSISGAVTSSNGPEAGVWVIAETTDLPTKYAKVVVTDDSGRYLIPELPKATYTVWTRGYGLVDSPKVKSAPGATLDLKAVVAPDAKSAAEYYPGMYWYSMINIPGKDQFPGTGEKGNGISSNIKTQEAWVDTVKNACQSCHALGSHGIRVVPK
ncbi:MAG TPA: carboxypeptidase-like regulatory domain-containing protein, partial [Burkholderiales bacterium]|nr:carboxypeptidase-like regulatory domain-containing protein [Burkholderiales bacterium]